MLDRTQFKALRFDILRGLDLSAADLATDATLVLLRRASGGGLESAGEVASGWYVEDAGLGVATRLMVAEGAYFADGTPVTAASFRGVAVAAISGEQYAITARERPKRQSARVWEFDAQPTANPWPPPEAP
jgi:hypothetical protein